MGPAVEGSAARPSVAEEVEAWGRWALRDSIETGRTSLDFAFFGYGIAAASRESSAADLTVYEVAGVLEAGRRPGYAVNGALTHLVDDGGKLKGDIRNVGDENAFDGVASAGASARCARNDDIPEQCRTAATEFDADVSASNVQRLEIEVATVTVLVDGGERNDSIFTGEIHTTDRELSGRRSRLKSCELGSTLSNDEQRLRAFVAKSTGDFTANDDGSLLRLFAVERRCKLAIRFGRRALSFRSTLRRVDDRDFSLGETLSRRKATYTWAISFALRV